MKWKCLRHWTQQWHIHEERRSLDEKSVEMSHLNKMHFFLRTIVGIATVVYRNFKKSLTSKLEAGQQQSLSVVNLGQ